MSARRSGARWLAPFMAGLFALTVHAAPVKPLDYDAAGRLAVQEGGRKKPLDTLARETLLLLTGHAAEPEHDPMEALFALWLGGAESFAMPHILVGSRALREELGLDPDQQLFSYRELSERSALTKAIADARAYAAAGTALSAEEREALAVDRRMGLLDSIVRGSAMRIIPHPRDPAGPWSTPQALGEAYPGKKHMEAAGAFRDLLQSYLESDALSFTMAAKRLRSALIQLSPTVYPGREIIDREVHYNHFRPFRKAWIICLVGWVVLLVNTQSKGQWLYAAALVLLFAGWLLQSYGFYLRCTIAHRSPVTNMYESVLWVSWGVLLFGILFEVVYRPRYFALVAAPLAVIGLILADGLPAALNPGLAPLVPVLRSNFWLTTHVLTITLSYAAFALALGLGHLLMGFHLGNAKGRSYVPDLTRFLYRVLQVGVLLLAVGTILGGVWAYYSWGRFWGWDPKETWALVALMGYLLVLHARAAGWLGPFGLGAAAIAAFLGVVMAWYGVNFMLGQGLHAYGFGHGGATSVSGYVAAELLFVVWAFRRYRKMRSK